MNTSTPIEATSTATTAVFLPVVTKEIRKIEQNFYVSTNGSPQGDGSMNKPWDLQTALSNPDVIQPGSTIWLRGGTYGYGGNTKFVSRIQGLPDKPIAVQPYPGEWVVIDGGFEIYNPWTIYQGLEVMNSNLDRSSDLPGPTPADITRTPGFTVVAPNTKIINNIIHDTLGGIGVWEKAENSEIYGNIIYNNGWNGPDRGHGHGIYAQNDKGIMKIGENVTFNNFGTYGLHIYSESVALTGFQITGNILIYDKTIIGGKLPTSGIKFAENHVYGDGTVFGYTNCSNGDLTLADNYFWSEEDRVLEVKCWMKLNVHGNTLRSGPARLVDYRYPDNPGSYNWNNNAYVSSMNLAFAINYQAKSWSQWRILTGFDQDSSFVSQASQGVEVYIRINKYDKRAYIIIYNWDRRNAVNIDLSGTGLQNGDNYSLHNVLNFFNEQIKGTYDGNSIEIPMSQGTVAKPIGWNEALSPSTFPQFAVFVLTVED